MPAKKTTKTKMSSVEAEIKKVIDEVRPQLQMDGGDIQYVGFDKGTVKVKLQGACMGCPMATETLKFGVEEYLKKKIKQVKEVIAVD